MNRRMLIQTSLSLSLLLAIGTGCITINNLAQPTPAAQSSAGMNADTPAPVLTDGSASPQPGNPQATVMPAPSLEPSPASKPLLRVILQAPESSLPVYLEPGPASPAIGELGAAAQSIQSTGLMEMADGIAWIEILLPDGRKGWVRRDAVSEDMNAASFCADGRIPFLVSDLAAALQNQDGAAMQSITSPVHGLYVQLYHSGNIIWYPPERIGTLFQDPQPFDWGSHPASAMDVSGSFKEKVLPDYLDVFQNDYTLSCLETITGGINYEAARPPAFANILYYTAYKPGSPGVDLDWRTVVIGIAYVDQSPHLVYLQQFFWEP